MAPATSLMCDDIEATRAELSSKGATLESPITDAGYGFTTLLAVPGADAIMLHQPNHPTAHHL